MCCSVLELSWAFCKHSLIDTAIRCFMSIFVACSKFLTAQSTRVAQLGTPRPIFRRHDRPFGHSRDGYDGVDSAAAARGDRAAAARGGSQAAAGVAGSRRHRQVHH